MYVFPELTLVFAYTSFPFGFDARLWGLIVTYVSDQFLPNVTPMELVVKTLREATVSKLHV